MTKPPQIVVFGATGYTGELIAEALVRRGTRPVLAGRSQAKLITLADRLGDVETRVADITDPTSVRALVSTGDVLVSTVGPFARWGGPAVDAAVSAGAHYIDTSGETAFIRGIFDNYGDAARRAGSALLPAFGYDYVPGTLAGALALQAAGARATQLEIGYFATGSVMRGLSSGTMATVAAGLLEPVVARRAGQTVEVRSASRVCAFPVNGRRRNAMLSGGSEALTLPGLAPHLQDIHVYNGWFPALSRVTHVLSATIAAARRIPVADTVLRRLVARAQGSRGGPDARTRAATRSHIAAIARDSAGHELAQLHVEGPSIYDLTAQLVAWAAEQAAAGALRDTGALGPIDALGLEGLIDGCAAIGLKQIDRPARGHERTRGDRLSHA